MKNNEKQVQETKPKTEDKKHHEEHITRIKNNVESKNKFRKNEQQKETKHKNNKNENKSKTQNNINDENKLEYKEQVHLAKTVVVVLVFCFSFSLLVRYSCFCLSSFIVQRTTAKTKNKFKNDEQKQ